MKSILFVLALVFMLPASYGSIMDQKKLVNFSQTTEMTKTTDDASNSAFNIMYMEKSCTVDYDITVTIRPGSTLHLVGTTTFRGISCAELIKTLETR